MYTLFFYIFLNMYQYEHIYLLSVRWRELLTCVCAHVLVRARWDGTPRCPESSEEL